MTEPTPKAFLARFLVIVGETLFWSGAPDFQSAVRHCANPQVVRGHFEAAGFDPALITAERLQQCVAAILPPQPEVLSVGTVVRYTGEDLSSIIPHDVDFVVNSSHIYNELGQVAYTLSSLTGQFHRRDLMMVAPPTAKSLISAKPV